MAAQLILDALDRPPSQSQLVYARLKQVLRDGRVGGGSLLSEADLARQLGVSTTPVHEAVVRLASEGFVEALPRRGVRVVHLTPSDIAEIFELREGLEAEVVRLVLARATADTLEILQSHVAAAEAALADADYPAFNAADVALHDALAHAAGNRRLKQALDDVRIWVQRIRLATVASQFRLPGRPAKAQEQHRRLVEALRGRDPAAESIIRQHISSLKEEILGHMQAHSIDFV
jgi:DNA-binding GntR family transcriptional regulator